MSTLTHPLQHISGQDHDRHFRRSQWHCCRLPFLESVMTKDWIHVVDHSPVCQIVLQMVVRALITSSPPAWTSSALPGCCRLQLTSLSSVIVLQTPLLCEGWGGHPLCLSGYSPVLMDLHWPCDCTAQCSILSIGSVSLVLL